MRLLLLLFDGESIAVDMLRGLRSLKLMWSTDEEESSIAHWKTGGALIFYLTNFWNFLNFSHTIFGINLFHFTIFHSLCTLHFGIFRFFTIFPMKFTWNNYFSNFPLLILFSTINARRFSRYFSTHKTLFAPTVTQNTNANGTSDSLILTASRILLGGAIRYNCTIANESWIRLETGHPLAHFTTDCYTLRPCAHTKQRLELTTANKHAGAITTRNGMQSQLEMKQTFVNFFSILSNSNWNAHHLLTADWSRCFAPPRNVYKVLKRQHFPSVLLSGPLRNRKKGKWFGNKSCFWGDIFRNCPQCLWRKSFSCI